MRIATTLGIAGFVVMASAIAYAFVAGDFWEEASQMIRLPWFHLSMIDLYAGFLMVSGWVFFRERARAVALVWLLLILTLGNLASFAYVVLAAYRSEGWREFWMGWRAETEPNNRLSPLGG